VCYYVIVINKTQKEKNIMETLQSTQVSDSRVVFGREALEAAMQAGEVEQEYLTAITSQQRREAVVDAVSGAKEAVLGYLAGIGANIKLETRMVVFDKLHGTNYREVRHALVEKQRREKFEQSIGLVALGKK
jgi:hypothetical protein